MRRLLSTRLVRSPTPLLRSPAATCLSCARANALPLLLPRARALSSAPPARVSNPLLDEYAALATTSAAAAEAPLGIANVKGMPVSPKKLRVVANLARGLYWREAMLQLEFCRKGISVFVKNGISDAVKNAEEEHGLDPTRLVVAVASVGKGTYRKELDYKNKGRAGIKKQYRSHLYIALKEVSADEVQRTRHYGRWRTSAKLLDTPWHERVAALPRYRPVMADYDPGEPREREVLALLDTAPPKKPRRRRADAGGGRMGASGRPRWKAL